MHVASYSYRVRANATSVVMNIVFYSRHRGDIYSSPLLAELDLLQCSSCFKRYCIDPPAPGSKRNEDVLFLFDLTEVPTMYVSGQELVGAYALEWIRKQREKETAVSPPAYEPPRATWIQEISYKLKILLSAFGKEKIFDVEKKMRAKRTN
jgi:hypothetical protein